MVIIDPGQPMHRSRQNDDGYDGDNQNVLFPVMEHASTCAAAYQAASEEDAKKVLHAMKNPSLPIDSLEYFLIPCSWMTQCRPYLDGSTALRPDCKIENMSFLATEHKISSSDEDDDDHKMEQSDDSAERKRRLRRLKWQERQRQNQAVNGMKSAPKLRTDLVYGRDYYLVGPDAWMLLSSKFGFDVALPRPMVFPATNSDNSKDESIPELSQMAVVINEGTDSDLVPIPLSGKFDDESWCSAGSSSADFTMDYGDAPAGWIGDTSASPQTDEQQQHPPTTDVVSEEEEINDLYPSPVKSPSHELTNVPVLLLPPSTSSNLNGGDQVATGSDKLYQSSEDMEYDSDGKLAATHKRKRYGSGLGNLGNTCFMNSTLQCLAHTRPLRRYFVSGEYEEDLNRDNPLGTGGELATQFAALLSEMWGTTSSNQLVKSNGYYSSTSNYSLASSPTPVVYPRNFKYTLGKHAEQFLGYDQHDSQELATYLLDALHEDTNRVTKKPYIEKPEQGEHEPDDLAADKAWQLHQKREDSRVLENFMGQVKSRVQCPVEGCGRVSTTFDPFMYLSVPIPGATDRTLTVTFVPLDPKERMKVLNVTLRKTSAMPMLQKRIIEELQKSDDGNKYETLEPEDLCLVDVWSNEVYSFYQPKDEIDKIRDTDKTFAFQLRPVSSIHEDEPVDDDKDFEAAESIKKFRCHKSKLDLATRTKLNNGDEWMQTMERYVVQPTLLCTLFNPKRGTIEDRTSFARKLISFIDLLHETSDAECDPNSSADTMDDIVDSSDDLDFSQSEDTEDDENVEEKAEEKPSGGRKDSADDSKPTMEERSEASLYFRNVRTKEDLAIMEFCAGKFRTFVLNLCRERKDKYKDGTVVHVVFHRKAQSVIGSRLVTTHHHLSTGEKHFALPMVLRVSSSLTVYGLRQELSERLSRSLKTGRQHQMQTAGDMSPAAGMATGLLKSDDFNGLSSTPSSVVPDDAEPEDEAKTPESNGESSSEVMTDSLNLGSPEMLIMRQIPMTYERKSAYSYKSSSTFSSYRKLGMLERAGSSERNLVSLASPSNEDEKMTVAEAVGSHGAVHLHWTTDLSEELFDLDEYETCEDVKSAATEAKMLTRKAAKTTTSVSDCIEKYCQMEQLEESEMWYCSRCKEHVRAWKQFHLYRAPPILIVHLKRFHFSATTHRRDKIDAFIDFPLTGLDLTKEVTSWTEEEKPVYDCYAVSNHYGGLGGGHYTAYALSDDGTWCHFDDSRVTTGIDPKEVVSNAAYVLYYRRRDVVCDRLEGLEEENTPAIVQADDRETIGSKFVQGTTGDSSRNRVEEMEVGRGLSGSESSGSDSGSSNKSSPFVNREMEVNVDPYSYHDEDFMRRDNRVPEDEEDYPLQ